ncbi:MAG: hypothetical protein M3Z03_07830 [Actinomycetota bacterium]|nr:hypothetical protein [Actinomycetota bacterium]
MGKASSAKKVARAARAGGRVSSGQPRSLLFPGIITIVVVLGTALVAYARDDRSKDDMGGVPQLSDHIHQAVAFVACGEFLPDLPEFESPVGIHTHGDGVIHVHPFSQLGVGSNATLDRYLKDARDDGGLDAELTAKRLKYQGETYEEAKTECEGVDDPILRVGYWPNVQDEASKPQVTTGDFTEIRLNEDGAGITVFFGDKDADIPKPPNAQQLTELGARDGGQTPDTNGNTTTVPADASSTTVAGDTTTTVGGEPSATSTTVAPADTTAPAAP